HTSGILHGKTARIGPKWLTAGASRLAWRMHPAPHRVIEADRAGTAGHGVAPLHTRRKAVGSPVVRPLRVPHRCLLPLERNGHEDSKIKTSTGRKGREVARRDKLVISRGPGAGSRGRPWGWVD